MFHLPLWSCFVLEIVRVKLQGNRSALLHLTRLYVVSWETKRAIKTKQQQLVFNHPVSQTPDMTLLRYEAFKISYEKCTKQISWHCFRSLFREKTNWILPYLDGSCVWRELRLVPAFRFIWTSGLKFWWKDNIAALRIELNLYLSGMCLVVHHQNWLDLKINVM